MIAAHTDTIVALATGRGGAIAVVRVSGGDAIAMVDGVFVARSGKPLSEAAGYTVHFGEIRDGSGIVDEVLVTVFRAPHSYTGENSVEISCHASPYIENRVVQLLLDNGARSAGPGEFTIRAFLAGKMDLAQAEAVADLIASSDSAGHSLAMGQLRGGVSLALEGLRAELLDLAALLELELDFSEEDVEFASRKRLEQLSARVAVELDTLAGSFKLGNAIREGVPVAIVGRPNTGKSTLLNALAGDDIAITSDIAGTTRDRIEERVNIGGIGFRFIDTAGLRATDDVLEQMGITRALEAASRARIVLLVVSAEEFSTDSVETQIAELGLREEQKLCVVVNKIDKVPITSIAGCLHRPVADSRRPVDDSALSALNPQLPPSQDVSIGLRLTVGARSMIICFAKNSQLIGISARTGQNLEALRGWLSTAVDTHALEAGAAVVSGARHYEALTHAHESVRRVAAGIVSGVSADLLAEDVREALHYSGLITGTVTSDDILGTIFSKFCIGK